MAMLAECVQAETLMILTAVEQVAINFGKPDMRKLRRIASPKPSAISPKGIFLRAAWGRNGSGHRFRRTEWRQNYHHPP